MSQKEKNRKGRAILAGGLVLGVGAAVTLAAWNDSEFAQGTFGAGHFNMQGSTNGTVFSDHAAAGAAAQLGFTAGFDNLSPGETVAAPFTLRLDPTTTNDAAVSVNAASATGTAANDLTYGIVQLDPAEECTSTAAGAQAVVPSGTTMDSVAGASLFTLAKSTVDEQPGADVVLCVQVTAGPAIAQGATATGSWVFLGTSTP
ncbi:SipW-dependent-type signal peptide-containing protein [Paeniglutamicibacter sp. ORCA_105]|uniref:SipW-dependent-type signal peptide-containing protein n=1 Tax=Paeniglutamicibacter sp. ORCA_105 TaxID=3377336 RepID=UPI003893AA5B